MRNYYRGFFIIGWVLFRLTVLGQGGMTLPQVTPKSPNAAGFDKYVDVPVSLSRGIPDVSIPITRINIDGLTIPISLTYHNTGLQIDEIPSWVGLGWDLQAGGMISFQQKDLNDFDPFGLVANASSYQDLSNFLRGNLTSTQVFDYQERILNDLEDAQFDLYNINFLGYTGTVYFDSAGQAHITPKSDLKVLKTSNGLKVIDLSGNTFFFETPENAISYPLSDVEIRRSFSGISAYYLSRIITLSGRTIDFKYRTYNLQYNRTNQSILFHPSVNQNCPGNLVSVNDTYVSTDFLLPDSILYDEGFIKFVSSNPPRQDLLKINSNDNIPSLSGIVIGNNKGAIITQFNLTQGYFGNNDRLKLSSVQEQNGTVSGRNWQFGYYGDDFAAFPPFFSKGKDHWGFYNGKSNPSLIPAAGYDTLLPNWINMLSSAYADRTSDFASSQLGLLHTLRYPTGGMSTFDYEPNQVRIHNYSDITGLSPFLQLPTGSLIKVGIAGDRTNVQQVSGNGDEHTVSGQFTLQYTGTYDFRIYQDVDPTSFESPIITFTAPDQSSLDHIYHTLLTNATSTSMGSEQNITLSAGTYTYSLTSGVYCNGTTNTCIPLQANFDISKWVSQADSSIGPYVIGGCRISKISTSDNAAGHPNLVKRFVYDDSIGHVVFRNIPFYYNQTLVGYFPEQTACLLCTSEYAIHDENVRPVAGNNIEYAYVTEYDDSLGINGKTENVFMTSTNEGGSLYGEPFVAPLNTSWRTGNLIYQKKYKYQEGVYALIDSTVHGYFIGPKNDLLNGIQVDYRFNCPNTVSSNWTQHGTSLATDFTEQFYENQLSRSEIFNNVITNTVNTNALSNYHTQPTLVEEFDSKGQSIKERIIYSFDYNTTGAISDGALGLNLLVMSHILVPIERIKVKNIGGQDYVIDATLNVYRQDRPVISRTFGFKSATPVALSSFVQSYIDGDGQFVMDSHYEPRIEFYNYDGNNNLIEVGKSNDKHISYIYDYKDLHPIAEAINADNASIAYTSFEADGTGNWAIGGGSVNTSAAFTGHNSYSLSGSISKSGVNAAQTYIVSYWSQGVAMNIAGTITGFPRKGKTITINNTSWTLYIHKVTGQSTISVSGTGTIDELRLYPATAQMTTYTYDPLVGMTSQTDAGNRVTYYEYDGLARVKRIRDQDFNIVKSYEYQYQTQAGCGSGCAVLGMQTFEGSATIGYPVGVFNVHSKLLGNASGPDQYVSLWNNDTADAAIGTLTKEDSLRFQLSVNAGKTPPPAVTGCRYYQYDLAWNYIDGIRMENGVYVDFGDGSGTPLPGPTIPVPASLPPNTTVAGDFTTTSYYYVQHSYPDTSVKTITIYHNDKGQNIGLDNAASPAIGLTKLKNLRGNMPQNNPTMWLSSYQDSTVLTVANLANWNSVSAVKLFGPHSGDGGANPCMHMNFSQDFMKNNSGLEVINTSNPSYTWCGYRDTSFKLSRLKTDWNTYFTQLKDIEISDEHWNREDLSSLTHLTVFVLVAGNQNHSDDLINNPLIPIPSSTIDNVISQIWAGAGQNNSNGIIYILPGGTSRTGNSDTALSLLKSKGWQVYIENILQ